ncbi:hypothetical protein D0T84_18780 [Dysgonomonas sp. 521]|uniref:hypothetical protein n=1 Tax=Dysgonomonas sp. 521 TaxID=2302932 RepID=UPI0013D508D4|nr:hypothetical protein [Dysgonomonas sp. 521]NDV96936.1 hypothetical protein [Dysgonomonas sp. 521]
MKKTNFKYSIYLVLLLISGFTFSSCSDDDEEENSNIENILIGKWQPVKISDEPIINDELFSPLKDDILEFSSDKTVYYDENKTYYGFANKPIYDSYKSTWSVRIEKFESHEYQILNFKDDGVFFFSEDFIIVSISDTKLVINNGLEYEFTRIK